MERAITKNRNDLMKAYIQLMFTSFTWALSTILIKLYIGRIPPFHMLMSRFFIGALFIFMFAPKKLTKIRKADIKLGLALGFLIFLSYALNILGLLYTTASKAGFLAALSVLFIPIFETFIRKKLPSKWTIISVVLSIIGLNLISGINGGSFNLGDLLTIGCALFYTFYIILLDRFGSDKDEFILSFIQLVSMFLASSIIVIFFEGFDIKAIQSGLLPLIIIGVLGTGMTMFLQTKAQKVASPESVGVILLGEPLFTLIMAASHFNSPYFNYY